MKRKRAPRFWYVGLIAALAVAVLVGCGAGQANPTAEEGNSGGIYVSKVLDTSYDGALDVSCLARRCLAPRAGPDDPRGDDSG